jgi:hypothetical protein
LFLLGWAASTSGEKPVMEILVASALGTLILNVAALPIWLAVNLRNRRGRS